jgi:hypothetical protein
VPRKRCGIRFICDAIHGGALRAFGTLGPHAIETRGNTVASRSQTARAASFPPRPKVRCGRGVR